ncbi:hypothetical protein ACEZCY_03455 [Streptacidiphilus sp. N1-12]|uniref:SAF domain-containing protein n=2 Tax=Streptacidiphilus alkalitolerans TaxID=3342712 RepID=A0ABV6WVI6_9ACTN
MTTTVEPERTAAPTPAPTPAAAPGAVEPGLDRPVRLIGARLWLGSIALLLAVAAGTAWGVLGALPHTLTLPGVVAMDQGAGPATLRLFVTSPTQAAQLTPGQLGLVPVRGGMAQLRITSVDAYPTRADALDGTQTVPGLPTGDTPVWTVHAVLDLPPGAADPDRTDATPVLVSASIDLGTRHPYQVLFGSTGAGR